MEYAKIERLATNCMDSSLRSVQDWHRVAGSAAEGAANEELPRRDRDCCRFEAAQALLKAAFVHHPSLTAAELLAVAARIAERADEGAQLADRAPRTSNDFFLLADALEIISPDEDADQERAAELEAWARHQAAVLGEAERLAA